MALALAGAAAAQDMSKFTDGPVITGFGKVTPIESDLAIPKKTVFRVILDVGTAAKPGEVNRGLDSAARFLNMHVAHGVPEKNIHIVVVVHGKAGDDLTNDTFYAARNEGSANATAPLVKQLLAHGVKVYICGQSATAFGISKADLLPGVQMSLSAMSTFAIYEQRGYVLLP
ncbi:DsrE family protein [Novosphingobium sp.]|uniref:DsrE family protein n=1 Tax=Novosphingobium sp. TaxID=1874826 RepID=UPI0035B2A310